jgi:diaminopimelate epimerase
MCGNASLCAARLASWVEVGTPDGVILHTDAGFIPARRLDGPGERAEIAIGEVGGIIPAPIERLPGELSAHFLRVGVPHLVLQVEKLDEVDVAGRGRTLRFHPAFADGANVSFVAPVADHWRMRTYERGVEQETLACGTGAVAVATVLVRVCDVALPVQILTSSGRILEVSGRPEGDGTFKEVCLRGEGRLVFRAVLGG